MAPSFSRLLESPIFLCACGAIIVLACVVLWFATSKTDKSQEHPQQHQQPQQQAVPTQTSSNKPALVLFYAKWCGASMQMKGEWDKAVGILREYPNLEVIEVSQEDHPSTIDRAANELGLKGFPDIRYFPNGIFNGPNIPYRGDRTEQSFVKFAYTGGKQV